MRHLQLFSDIVEEASFTLPFAGKFAFFIDISAR